MKFIMCKFHVGGAYRCRIKKAGTKYKRIKTHPRNSNFVSKQFLAQIQPIGQTRVRLAMAQLTASGLYRHDRLPLHARICKVVRALKMVCKSLLQLLHSVGGKIALKYFITVICCKLHINRQLVFCKIHIVQESYYFLATHPAC